MDRSTHSIYPLRFLRLIAPLAASAVLLGGCATSQLSVESDPAGAEIYVVSAGSVKQKIGVTPLTITPAQI